jgi:hypothetical protein
MSQLHDEGIKIIKLKLSQGEAKYKCFHTDHQGVLWFNNRTVVPKDHQLRKQILDEAHLSKFSIHPGSTKMYQDLRQNFWWTRMKREIAKYVSESDMCQRVKASHLKASGTLQPVPIQANLKTAQSRQKSYADQRRKPLQFQVGDFVYLRVSPTKGVQHFGIKGKLAPRYVRPSGLQNSPSISIGCHS